MGRRLAPLALLAALAALAGCGGGGSTTGQTSTATSAPSAAAKPPASGGQKAGGAAGKTAGGGGARPETAEEGVERFGSEAAGGGRNAVIAADQRYLNAIAGRDFAGACSLMAKQTAAGLEQIVPPGQRGKISCAAILTHILSPAAAGIARQQAGGTITKVRIKGSEALVIFHAPGARLWAQSLVREGDSWKVSMLQASILAPSAGIFKEHKR